MMDEKTFTALAGTYGANLDRWPEACQHEARAFCAARTETANRILQDERTLDALLDQATKPVRADTLLRARILKHATSEARSDFSIAANAQPARTLPWKAVAATFVLTTGLGFGAGQLAAAQPGYSEAETLLALSMNGQYSEADLLDINGSTP